MLVAGTIIAIVPPSQQGVRDLVGEVDGRGNSGGERAHNPTVNTTHSHSQQSHSAAPGEGL